MASGVEPKAPAKLEYITPIDNKYTATPSPGPPSSSLTAKVSRTSFERSGDPKVPAPDYGENGRNWDRAACDFAAAPPVGARAAAGSRRARAKGAQAPI